MNHDDSKLRELLENWRADPWPVPGFNAGVWARIAAAEETAPGWAAVLRDWFLVRLPRPGYAAVVLAVTALAGAGAARVRAGHEREQYRVEAARQYLATIDPMAMTAGMTHPSR